MGNFIDPRVDWAFKRIFGSEDTKECLITFLNGLFKGELVIKDVKFEKTEQVRQSEKERGVIFDVNCTTHDGRHIIVEMQKKEQEHFVDRALYYSAKAIVGQGLSGNWDFHLAPVYTVCLMNFKAKRGIPHQFRTDVGFSLLNKAGMPTKSKKRFGFEKVRIVYLQLPFFKKRTAVECMDIFECWIYVIKNMEKFKEMPFIKNNPVFRKLAEIGDLRKLSFEEQQLYDEDIKIMRDLYATHKYEEKLRRESIERAKKRIERGVKKRIEQGVAKGVAQGLAEGLEQGIAQGKEKGETTRAMADAKRFLVMGLTPEQVAEGTQLPLEQVMKLVGQA